MRTYRLEPSSNQFRRAFIAAAAVTSLLAFFCSAAIAIELDFPSDKKKSTAVVRVCLLVKTGTLLFTPGEGEGISRKSKELPSCLRNLFEVNRWFAQSGSYVPTIITLEDFRRKIELFR